MKSPVRFSRRRLLTLMTGATGAALMVSFPSPHLRQLRAMGSSAASNGQCGATLQQLLGLIATVEALSATFYYQAITASDGFFRDLVTDYQRYLRVSLDAEWFHYRFLVDQRAAQPQPTTFFFPVAVFTAGHFADFLTRLNELETHTIALYLTAIRELGSFDEPVLAELLGQMVGIEAEQRVLGREMAHSAPPPPNDRCYEPAHIPCAALVEQLLHSYLHGGAGFAGPVALPDQTAVEAAVGTAQCDHTVSTATAITCSDTLSASLDIAAIAEAVGITLYYQAIQGGFFGQLSQAQQWYLQAALDEERQHLEFLLSNGAAAPPTQFFFAAGVFDDLPRFLVLLDSLENSFIAAYLAAIQHFHRLGQPLLAEIAGQILGVEAGHRVLGRVIDQQAVPHNLGFARATYGCLTDAQLALAPFLTGNAELTVPAALPSTAEIDQAVDRFGCTPIPVAAPTDIYLPMIARL